jgi:hypothetical protein
MAPLECIARPATQAYGNLAQDLDNTNHAMIFARGVLYSQASTDPDD